jgi:type IV pilus assembly protein PilB
MASDLEGQSFANTFESFLADNGYITPAILAQLQTLKASMPGKGGAPEDVGNILVAAKMMEEEDVAKARAAFLNMPYADLRSINIPPTALNTIAPEARVFYHMVPFALEDNVLKVAIADPGNLQALEALEFLGQKQNLQIQLHLASLTSIQTIVGEKKNLSNVVGQALEDIQTGQEQEKKRVGGPQKKIANQVIEDAPIIKIVDVVLQNAIDANASDIHIEPSDNDVRVRYRIDGVLHNSLSLPRNVLPAIISRIKILANLKIDETRLPQDGRFHVDLANRSVDLRVSVLPLIYGEKVVMRLLDKSISVPTLEQLGLSGKGLAWVNEHLRKTHGVFLITGPTGSGKSTTLYAILSKLNSIGVNIITLEDPVEYFIEGVNQSQINPDIGLTFASGLHSILRQDPNIIMVGEIRDEETAELAVHAALTGHLVFSTLHTNNAIGAIPRLMNMNIEPFLLEASINLVLAQRLVRKLCDNCRGEVTDTPDHVFDQLMKELGTVPPEYLEGLDMKKPKLYKGKGCEKCSNIGYRGRIGIFEVLPMFPELQELIYTKAPTTKIYEAAAKLGMITMKQDGILKSLRGETSLEEVMRVTTE